MNSNINIFIEQEFNRIYDNYWKFMKKDYVYYEKLKYHRKKIENVKNIDKIKQNIYDKIGSIPTFVFLTDLCSHIYLPGPYNTIDKALLLLEHLLNGYSFEEMDMYMPSSTFYKLYRNLYIKNYDFLEEWINNKLKYCFSSPILRLLCAKKFNPSLVDNITLLLDGHHNRIVYQNVFLDKKELYSWKLKKNGLNTQFLIDVNKMCIYVSDSLPCKMNNDDNMFLNINLNNFYNETDCICFDGLYENTLDEFIDKYKNIGYNISLQNFCFPIKKTKNIDLLEDEIKFNDILGGFRSKIESYFAELGSVFKRFSGQTKVRVTESKIYNIQLKLAIVLLNIKYFKELFNLEEVNHYNKWRIDNFDYSYSNNIELNLDVSLKTKYKVEEINNIKNVQLDFINKLKIRDKNNSTLYMDKCDESMDIEEEVYEVQYIIKHKKVLSNFEYYVKWRNYGKEKNSWVKDTDFTETTIITEYWSSISRK
jgi:hypothetical protein